MMKEKQETLSYTWLFLSRERIRDIIRLQKVIEDLQKRNTEKRILYVVRISKVKFN